MAFRDIVFMFGLFLLMWGIDLSAQWETPPDYEYLFSHEIEQQLQDKKLRIAQAAYAYTYIGQSQKAYQTYELPVELGLDTLTAEKRAFFNRFQPMDAVDYVLELADEHEVTIVSEAHQKPEHRVFTKSLLSGLYERGYRYLGIEAVSPHFADTTQFIFDTLMQERGYPLHNPLSGSYTQEPQMANMIREAISLGFVVFGYDYFSRKPERDLHQAMRIQKLMNEMPEGKVLLHCGWYHAADGDLKKRKGYYMAHHLKKLTGIDPLTIYQDALTEKTASPESSYYQGDVITEPAVLVDDQGHAFGGFKGEKYFDILLMHPRTQYYHHRPSWLYRDRSLRFVAVPNEIQNALTVPIIVAAYPINQTDGVAMDVIEVEASEEVIPLLLRPGKYLLKAKDASRGEMSVEIEVFER